MLHAVARKVQLALHLRLCGESQRPGIGEKTTRKKNKNKKAHDVVDGVGGRGRLFTPRLSLLCFNPFTTNEKARVSFGSSLELSENVRVCA